MVRFMMTGSLVDLLQSLAIASLCVLFLIHLRNNRRGR